MARVILNIADCSKQFVRLGARPQPFEIDQLTGKELGKRLRQLAIRIYVEESKAAGRIIAPGMHASRNVMEVIEPVTTRSEK